MVRFKESEREREIKENRKIEQVYVCVSVCVRSGNLEDAFLMRVPMELGRGE